MANFGSNWDEDFFKDDNLGPFSHWDESDVPIEYTKAEKYLTDKKKLDGIDIRTIERYLREKKLEKLKR